MRGRCFEIGCLVRCRGGSIGAEGFDFFCVMGVLGYVVMLRGGLVDVLGLGGIGFVPIPRPCRTGLCSCSFLFRRFHPIASVSHAPLLLSLKSSPHLSPFPTPSPIFPPPHLNPINASH